MRVRTLSTLSTVLYHNTGVLPANHKSESLTSQNAYQGRQVLIRPSKNVEIRLFCIILQRRGERRATINEVLCGLRRLRIYVL